jgi:hypothetical protein
MEPDAPPSIDAALTSTMMLLANIQPPDRCGSGKRLFVFLRLKKVTPRPGTRNAASAAAPASVAGKPKADRPAAAGVLDESGASTQMTRNYGRAPGGERVAEGTPQSHWHSVTLLAALTTEACTHP